MRYSEGLDTTGVSDLASGWGYEETRANQGTRIIYITDNPGAPASSEHAQSSTFRLLAEASLLVSYPLFFYLSKVSRLPTKTKSEAFCYAPDTYKGLGNVFPLFSVTDV